MVRIRLGSVDAADAVKVNVDSWPSWLRTQIKDNGLRLFTVGFETGSRDILRRA
jgi:hypothetical protein